MKGFTIRILIVLLASTALFACGNGEEEMERNPQYEREIQEQAIDSVPLE